MKFMLEFLSYGVIFKRSSTLGLIFWKLWLLFPIFISTSFLKVLNAKAYGKHLYKKHALSLPTKGQGNKVHKSKKWWYGKENVQRLMRINSNNFVALDWNFWMIDFWDYLSTMHSLQTPMAFINLSRPLSKI